jgi:hypothetical protein
MQRLKAGQYAKFFSHYFRRVVYCEVIGYHKDIVKAVIPGRELVEWIPRRQKLFPVTKEEYCRAIAFEVLQT